MALTQLAIDAAKPRASAYRLNDGGSLYLVVRPASAKHPAGTKSWEFRWKRAGTVRARVLGTVESMGLKAARGERDRLKTLIAAGLDPAAEKHVARERQRAELSAALQAKAARRAAEAAARLHDARQALTVKAVAEAWIASARNHWTPKHVEQVEQSLADHVYSKIGDRPIEGIAPVDVLDVMEKLLADGKVETARRVRQRLDAVFEFAGLRHQLPNNPVAVAKREINKRVKAALKANPEGNYPCVPVAEVPQLLRAMRAYVGTPVTRALMWFVAMTGCRTGEARFATWNEFTLDGDDPQWVIPAARMKAGREHVVALAPVVVSLLNDLRRATGKRAFVFPHPRRDDRPASENAVLYALAAIGFKDRMSGHGFRSIFSTLANESELFRPDVIEVALAHAERDSIRAAYNKATLAAARRRLAHWYADELARLEAGTAASVVSISTAVPRGIAQ